MKDLIEKEGVFKVTPQTTVCDYDRNQRLTLFAFLKYQQEAAEQHANVIGYSYDEMIAHNMVFLVNQSRNIIHRMPEYHEKIHIFTWASGTKGVRFYRCFEWYSESGEHLASGMNVYIIVNVLTHKPLKSTSLYGELKSYDYSCAARDYMPKIQIADTEFVGTKTVLFTDLDVNNHLNNARYADVLQNFLPESRQNDKITGFAVDFVKEAPLGMNINIEAVTTDCTVMQGIADDKVRFRGYVEYEN